jgi:hypothetical protein
MTTVPGSHQRNENIKGDNYFLCINYTKSEQTSLKGNGEVSPDLATIKVQKYHPAR